MVVQASPGFVNLVLGQTMELVEPSKMSERSEKKLNMQCKRRNRRDEWMQMATSEFG